MHMPPEESRLRPPLRHPPASAPLLARAFRTTRRALRREHGLFRHFEPAGLPTLTKNVQSGGLCRCPGGSHCASAVGSPGSGVWGLEDTSRRRRRTGAGR